MLADRDYQLLTAYVDGELSVRQRKTVLRLLHKSSEARALLRQLQANVESLRGLPRRKLGADFPLRVLHTIGQRGLQPGIQPAVAARSTAWPTWAGWAAAAAVLLSVGAAAYFTFPLLSRGDRHARAPVKERPASPHLVEKPPRPRTRPAPERLPDQRVAQAPKHQRAVPVRSFGDEKADTAPVKKSAVKKPRQPAQAPRKVEKPQPSAEPDIYWTAGPKDDQGGAQVANPNLSLMMDLRDLETTEATAKLRAKLQKDNAYQVQMLCRDTGKGLGQMRTVLAAHGIQLLIDREAQARLNSPRLKTKYVLYAENLKPEELVALLQQLGTADKLAARNKVPGQFGVLLVNSMPLSARQQIARFLETAPPPRASGKKGPLGVDLRKPLSEGTVRQVEKALKEKRKPQSTSGQPVAVTPGRQVLVLAYNEDNSPVNRRARLSREVKQFRAGRKDRLANTLQVVLVLARDNV